MSTCRNVRNAAGARPSRQMSVRFGSRSGIIHRVPNHTKILDVDGSISLTFYCGDLPADAAIRAAGHEPNGYFWEGMVQYLSPELAGRMDLDSEAGMFAANGELAALEQLQALIDPYLDDAERVAVTIRQAEASGFQFDD